MYIIVIDGHCQSVSVAIDTDCCLCPCVLLQLVPATK